MKKKYVKPTMEIFDLPKQSQLLVGSTPDYNGPIGYTPGIETKNDLNHLA